jgi:hypothetical protein
MSHGNGSVAFYDGHGRLLAREYRLEDGSSKPLNARDCAFMYRYKYRIHSDAQSALRAAGLTNALRTAGVKVMSR